MPFKKLQIPWNKGKKLHYKVWNAGKTGIHLSLATEFKKGENTGENHHLWKGDNVSYASLHKWIYRYKNKPKKCEQCEMERRLYWANKSRHYKRDLNDWLTLCQSCHMKYDKVHLKRKRDVKGRFLSS